MKVKMLTSMAGMNFSWEPGRVVEVEDYIGKVWEEAGIARRIEIDRETVAETGQNGLNMPEAKREDNATEAISEADTRGPGEQPTIDLEAITNKKVYMARVKEVYGWDMDGRKSLKNLKTEVIDKILAHSNKE